MPLWKLILAYDGTPFHGWQIQPGLSTVQGTLAAAILHVTGEDVLPQGSGRTDTGVHALGQVASFELAAPIPAQNLHRALNRALPPSIRILSLEAAPEGFHARYSAVRKTYEYRIFPHDRWQPGLPDRICSPMLAPWVWDCRWPLDLDRMQQAAQDVLGTHDFTSFAASDPDRTARKAGSTVEASNVRTIFASDWTHRDELLVYRVTGSGFLHHMVRNLVGAFVDAGAGRIAAGDIAKIIAAQSRSAAGPTAPASGLFLVEVVY
ncbi:tRNA pseudouridine38-40 synthase [Granulicella rosea]|uniref:tRNA pseudouridine synthase A n=1 Tax=Granulicella rosea TaxID=474952 RepID=A0A239J7G6_9BACT|nr:tRNA pseudouridine(38-40) synthase TruA [Granulicella rosea]SNT01438.1 tRNA pseudouridine38-40 synthase [Granulicella rosea]